MRGSNVDEELKEKARALLATRMSVKEVHEKTGVPLYTLYHWKRTEFQQDDEFAKLRNENKEKIIKSSWKYAQQALALMSKKISRATRLESEIEQLINRLKKQGAVDSSKIELLISKANAANAVTLGDVTRAYGVLIDKINLLSGEATDIVQLNQAKFEDL